MTTVTEAYAARAAEYTELIGSVDAAHPSDRSLIDSWARSIRGPVVDAGCGPGHWTDHLAGLGFDARGIDLVALFIAGARVRYPGRRFDVECIEAIAEADGSLGGILSWFSTIHHLPSQIAAPLAEFARVTRPGGGLLLGYFDAETTEPFAHAVTTAHRWAAADLRAAVERVGFDVVEIHRRSVTGAQDVGAIVCERRAGPAG